MQRINHSMIFIISEILDSSSNNVIDWVLASTNNFIRVNKFDLDIVSISYESKDVIFKYKNTEMSSKEISSFWYRRGYIQSHYEPNLNNHQLERHAYYHLDNEWNEIIRFFTETFEKKTIDRLGSYQVKDKKLTQLYNAKDCGLIIPRTLITTKKSELISFKEKCNNSIITKGIDSSPSFTFENTSLEGYTELVSNEFIQSLPSTFPPSMFQENIEKLYELRIFYLKETFYSMAIFSQKNEQTKTDVRKYDDVKPNRTIPYQLPQNIQKSLKNFMISMDLDTGSIDMLVDKNNNFYFLEVNPNGQFGMVSTPCNYYIERAIAKKLV